MDVAAKVNLENQIFLDIDKLCQAITAEIKMLVINSPNNPAGVMISREIMSDIARLAMAKDLPVLSDEICEYANAINYSIL